ncbi:MAG: imidazoleglycerol-phosphate dehydratase HisB [Promethearchaeota archaeon]
MTRQATVERKTKETFIEVVLNLDGTGENKIDTGIPLLDHMIRQIAVHGVFDLEVKAEGDTSIDAHHTMEDVAIVLGQAFCRAIGDKTGITRTAHSYVPMDEALAFVAVDFSNRPYWVVEIPWTGEAIGITQDTIIPVTLIEHFIQSFAVQAGLTLHAKVLTGRDDHHKAEAVFKALGRALDQASRIDSKRQGTIPSTKGTLQEKGTKQENNAVHRLQKPKTYSIH